MLVVRILASMFTVEPLRCGIVPKCSFSAGGIALFLGIGVPPRSSTVGNEEVLLIKNMKNCNYFEKCLYVLIFRSVVIFAALRLKRFYMKSI